MAEGTRRVLELRSEKDVLEWLERRDFDDPTVAAKEIETLLSEFIRRAEAEGDSETTRCYHAVLDWLDSQDARGVARNAGQTERALAATGRLCHFYHYAHRPLRGMTQLADEALACFWSASVENAPYIARLLQFIQARSQYRTAEIDKVVGVSIGRNNVPAPAKVSTLWMREPMGGAARFLKNAHVGIVVTCYNLGEYLFETLDSIARQTLSECELVIVNDGSTCLFTNAYIQYLEARGYQVLNQSNTGLAEARNNGIRVLSSRLICCFDADDLMHPKWLERASSVLAVNHDVGFVSCYYRTFDNDHSVYRYDHPRYPEMLVENQTVGVSVFRRECWERTGGYCRDFQGMEDWDFWLSVLDAGYQGFVIPEVLFSYRVRLESMYAATRATDIYVANIALLMARHQTAFESHWSEVARLRARQFVELLNVRSAEAQSYRYERAHLLITNQGYQEQAKSWERAATEANTHAKELSQTIAQLEGDKYILQEDIRATLSVIEAMMSRPGFIGRCLRNVLLVASNASGGAKWKNCALSVRLLLNRNARAMWKKHFDANWYSRMNPDVVRSGNWPWLHYLTYGHVEGRAASAEFDSAFYLQRHPDVRKAGLNPLLHYCLFGAHERRTAAPREPNTPPQRRTDKGEAFRSYRRSNSDAAPVPLVTVVIPCFNYGSYLPESLESVRQQTLSNVETIVVEGGSTDEATVPAVKKLEQTGLERVRFLYRQEPHLTGDNRNFGIASAATKYICCLDADDKLKPHYLEVAVFLAETYGYDLVYPSVQAFEGDTFLWSLTDADPKTIAEYNQVSTVAMFTHSAWAEVDGFRDFGRKTEHVAEDWDFWVRLLRSGYQSKSISQPLHMYRVHKASLWHGDRSSYDYQRTKIIEANRQLLTSDPPTKPLQPAPNAWAAMLQQASTDRAILLALPFVIIGGAEKIFEAIIRSETAQGRKVIVITTLVLADTMKDAAEHFQALTPFFYALPSLFGENLTVWDDFVSYLIDQYSVDLIMIAGSDYMYHALPSMKRAFPNVAVVDQLFNEEVHFPTNRHYARYIDVTIVPSPAFAARIVEEFNEKPARTAVIPHGVEIPLLPEDVQLFKARQQSGIPADWTNRFIIGFFGRMSPEKAPADYVEIARLLRTETDMRFVMTGEGPESTRVNDLIRRYGLADRMFTPGFVEDPHDLMAAVDVVVVPSRLDGMPLVVMESQALGKTVVASRVGSIPVMIEDGETGLLCDPGDVKHFAAKLKELHVSPEMCSRIGRQARRWAEEHHSAAAMMQRYEGAFRRARSARTVESERVLGLDPCDVSRRHGIIIL